MNLNFFEGLKRALTESDFGDFDNPNYLAMIRAQRGELDDAEEIKQYVNGASAWVNIAVNRKTKDVQGRDWGFVDNRTGEPIAIEAVPDEIKTAFINGFTGGTFGDDTQTIIPFSDLIGHIVNHEDFTGNALWVKGINSMRGQLRGIAEEFVPITPGRFKIILSPNGTKLLGYGIVLRDGTRFTVGPKDVIHFKQFPMISPYVGIGLISQARLAIESEKVAAEFQLDFFENDATPDIAVIEKVQRNPEDIDRLGKKLREQYEAKRYKNSILYMAGKDLEIKTLNVTNGDMQFLENRQYDKQTIISMFETNEFVLGMTQQTNRATAVEAINSYLGGTINTRILHIMQNLNQQFIWPIDNTISVWIELSPTGNVDDIKKMIEMGTLSPNEGAEQLGNTTVDDEANDARYISRAVIPVEQSFAGLPGVLSDSIDSLKKSEYYSLDYNCIVDLASKSRESISEKKLKEFNKDTKRNSVGALAFQVEWLKTATKSKDKTAKRAKKRIGDFFIDQTKRVAENLGQEDIPLSKPSDSVKQSDSAKQDVVQNVMDLIFNDSLENGLLNDDLKAVHTAGIIKAIDDTNELSGAAGTDQEVEAGMGNPQVLQAIMLTGVLATRINQASKTKIALIIEQGIEDGLSITEIARNIEDLGPEWEGARSLTIARTETRIAYDKGNNIAFKKLGVKTYDIVGCTGTIQPGGGIEGRSASYGSMDEKVGNCGILGIPVAIMGSVRHHPNHQGSNVPSEIPRFL